MAKKPVKKTAANKSKSKAPKTVAKKVSGSKFLSGKEREDFLNAHQVKLNAESDPKKRMKLRDEAARVLGDSSVPHPDDRLTREQKNVARKELYEKLKAEKDPVKRTALRREAASLLKY